jgi:hypothetical protein
VKLLSAYTNEVNTADAKKRAEAETKRIREALAAKPGDLAAAAGELKFQPVPAFSINDVTDNAQNVQDIQKKFSVSLANLTTSLKSITAPGVVLEPELARLSYGNYGSFNLGYQLFYVAERTVPAVETAKREEIRARLLLNKQAEAMNNFMMQLEQESNTLLRPDTSYTSGMAQ